MVTQMATAQEIIDKHRCPICGDELMHNPDQGEKPDHWNEIAVWCTDMGHWAGQIKDCAKAQFCTTE